MNATGLQKANEKQQSPTFFPNNGKEPNKQSEPQTGRFDVSAFRDQTAKFNSRSRINQV